MVVLRRLVPIAALCMAGATPAVELSADVRGLDAAEARASDRLLVEATSRLPPTWAAALPPGLRIEWRDDLPPHVDGRYRGEHIRLRRGLLDAAARGDERPALAALLHELAHAWDRSAEGGLSRDPRLLDLAGWQVAPLHLPRTRNAFRERTPDAYELRGPREFVAVNLEHLLLDPSYACRRPALRRHLAERAGLTLESGTCAPAAFVRADSEGAADPAPLLELDPSRVYAVDYLLAEPDARPMSRWGHSMLRLVVCAPGRTPGPDCRLDVAWHEVLSFRAFVDDVRVSAWRGLAGGYPSRLFVLPLPRVVDEYTKVELRGLRSVPLRLSPAEIAAVLDRAAQVQWSYDGRYRFVTSNCAVETWRLLHDAVPRLAAADLGSLTPTGLLRRLQRAQLLDAGPIDADEALRLGYRFESTAMHFQTLLDVARAGAPVHATRVRDWLALAPSTRATAFDDADLRAASALLVLENAALRRAEHQAADAFGHSPRRHDTRVDEALARAARAARPPAWVSGGYGVPDADERARALPLLADGAVGMAAAQAALRDAAEAALPPRERERLRATRANVDRLGARVRELAREAGVPSAGPG